MKKNILAFIVASALLVFTASCSNDDITKNTEKSGEAVDNKENVGLTTFVSTGLPNNASNKPSNFGTRTSMDYNTGHFFWEKNDRVYVKDENNQFNRSSNAVVESKQAVFKFMLPGTYKAQNKYMVYYPGEEGVNDQVTIKDYQQQDEPNSNKHFGTSGDCGMGFGETKDGKKRFDFTLVDKAAYLCFLPFTSHDFVSTYITEIEVVSDNNIAGAYTLDPTTNKLEGSGNSKTIRLHLGGGGNYKYGFQLNNHDKSLATNGAFMVIAPGTHTLTIKYHVKDIQTKVEGVITKTLKSKKYDENNYYDISSKLNVQAYDSKVYMWDAKFDYWYNYESEQPALPDVQGPNYPKSFPDQRWHSMANLKSIGGTKAVNEPTKSCPNVNEMLWYCMKGNPHWDANKLWTILKHLYKGGAWLLKKENIANFSREHFIGLKDKNNPALGTERYDYRNPDGPHLDQFQTEWSKNFYVGQDSPSKLGKDQSKYFFLPTYEGYMDGRIRNESGYGMGLEGMYWSSTPYYLSDGTYGAFQFGIKARRLGIYRSTRKWGLRCVEFQ